MKLNDKIRRFINDKDLTSTKFADEIGVPRPSISHILSDRNKPSLEIVQKIYKRYPELGFDWFLEDEENDTQLVTQSTNSQVVTQQKRPIFPSRESSERKVTENTTAQQNLSSTILPNFGHGNVARIIVVYNDGNTQVFESSNA
ncbi:helix-turn-helix transcriptional regulator [Emticicia sp. BO119]|uniref:helix-turn-helix transcriptional regulator n=1 Tax=Emticicia sp. BO119 TaxID=2757768 RepID=UPI0015F03BAF|nr:helix-turn-helix transcriptional regulator [Emticicia sp. BO119]MBA4853361.1 helix-turn-helix transcriptional regulator [Emticicia sp. BO119]